MRHRQQGITFIGLLLILSLVGVIGYGGIRLVPVYLNFIKVSRTMEQVAKEFKGENPDPVRIRVSLERHWTIEDISEINAKDIEVKKDGESVVLHAGYDHTVPYLGNVSLTASFDKSVTIE
jgi:hypothetical protein